MEGSAGGRLDLNVAEKFSGDPASWPFGAMQPFSYDFAMVDFPWPTKMRSQKGEWKSHARYYGSMSWAQMEAFPLGQLLAPNAMVMFWATWPLLLHSGDPERHFVDADASLSKVGRVIKAMGLRYVSGGSWIKRTKTGKMAFGPGYRVRSSCEPFLLAINGKPQHSRSHRNAIDGLRRMHSQKPEEAYAWAETYMPHARRAEIFSRTPRRGWDTWGYEAGKFDPVIALQARAA